MDSSRKGSGLWLGVALLLILLIAIIQLRNSVETVGDGSVAMSVAPCDLAREACRASLDGRVQLALSVTPRPITVITPLKVVVDHSGEEIRRGEIRFTGIGMDMGVNRFTLQPEAGRLVGEAMLPVCVESRMPWRATLWLETASGMVTADFDFESRKP